MASSKSKKTRKSLAIGLAIVGVAGLSLAAASSLSLSGTSKFQAGQLTVNADCQGTTQVNVAFGAPSLNTTTGKYNVSNLAFSGIVDACKGLYYKAAIEVGTTWTEVGSGTVPSTGTAPFSVTQTIANSIAADDIVAVSLTIYS